MTNELTPAELKEQNINQMDIILQQSNEIDRLDKRVQSLIIRLCLMSFVASILGMIIIYK